MRGYICDDILNAEEIQYSPQDDRHKWDACSCCLAEIEQVYDDPLTEEEIDALLAWEENTGFFDLENIPD